MTQVLLMVSITLLWLLAGYTVYRLILRPSLRRGLRALVLLLLGVALVPQWFSAGGSPTLFSVHALLYSVIGLSLFLLIEFRDQRSEGDRAFRLPNWVFENLQDGVFVACVNGEDYRFQRVNDSFLELLEKDRNEVEGESVDRCLDVPERAQELRSRFHQCRREAESIEFAGRLGQPEPRVLSTRLTPVVDDGEVERIIGIVRNVNEGMSREPRPRENELLLEELTESTDDVFWLFDRDFEQLLFINSSYEEIWGRSIERLRDHPRDFLEGIHPDDRDLILEKMKRVSSGQEVDLQVRVNPSENFKTWVSIHGRPVFDSGNSVQRVAGYSRDITELKQQEQKLKDLNERFGLILDGAEIGTWDWDLVAEDLVANETLANMVGYELAELDPGPDLWYELVHPSDESTVEFLAHTLKTGDRPKCDEELRLRTAEGTWKWVRVLGKVVDEDKGGNPARASGIHIDISDQKHLQRTLQERNSLLQNIVTTQEIISTTAQDSEAIFEVMNRRLSQLTGSDGVAVELLEGEELVCRSANGLLEDEVDSPIPRSGSLSGWVYEHEEFLRCDDVQTTDHPTCDQVERLDLGSLLVLPLTFGGECFGVLKTVSRSESHFDDTDERVLSLMGGFLSSTISHARQFEEMETRAKSDELTGLNNRREILRRLQEEVDRSQRYDNDLTLALLDVDHFKRVNDSYGHPVGDRVLEEVADILRSETRRTDILGRHGGEEFAIVLTETGREEARNLVERVLTTLREQSFTADGESFQVTASVGICSLQEDVDERDDLIKYADKVLYRAKREGRDRYRIFSGGEEPRSSPEFRGGI